VGPVRDREEPGRTGKDVQQEVSRKQEGVHVDVAVIDQPGHRVDLIDAGELHFVDHEDLGDVREEHLDRFGEVATRFHRPGPGLDADAARHHPVDAPVAEDPRFHVAAALSELPAELQRQRRLARGHGPVGKGGFGVEWRFWLIRAE
jgi:hypothetical protein